MSTIENTGFTVINKPKLPKPAHISKYLKERTAIEENYDFLNCSITSNGLVCEGSFSSPQLTMDYEVKIEFNLPNGPKVFVLNPKIKFNENLHMYCDNSLCLYYPDDNSFTINSMLFDTIIPWTSEWLIFYELHKLTGKWLGKYKPH